MAGDGEGPSRVWSSTDDFEGDYEPRFIGYHDLMRHKIREILLVSSLYDAFILEEDGGLSEQIFGEYRGFELTSPPRVIRVSSGEMAIRELESRNYDLVITMTHLYDLDPAKFGLEVKKIRPGTPVVLLVTDLTDLQRYHLPKKLEGIDKVFHWTGDSTLFLAITKFFEDQINSPADAAEAGVRVILVVENSARFYSLFLPQIYSEIFQQTNELVAQGLNEHERLYKRMMRPRILLAENYEEAMSLYRRYQDNTMAVITDVTFPVEGADEEEAGFRLVNEIDEGVPILVQSSHEEHGRKAESLGLTFLDKNSENFLRHLRRFMKEELGFGRFVFRLPSGEEVGSAMTMREFTGLLATAPVESLLYHAASNHFSRWLVARGEFEVASELRPRKISDFASPEDIREHLIQVVMEASRRKQLGVIMDFAQQDFEFEETITRLGGGSLGGKGRGIAFLSVLLQQSDLEQRFPGFKVRIPDTLIIGTEMFDRFVSINDLDDVLDEEKTDDDIADRFLGSTLPEELLQGLRHYLRHVDTPVAVRSSSLLEDSYNQPFAGIYSTYHLPNDPSDDERRLGQLCQALKLVYASAFFGPARTYIQTTLRKAEEEKMGVVIQKLVGNRHDDRFYPLFSGVIQSNNFYPVPPMKRDEPIAYLALGLGKIVVEGGRTLPFSPSRPESVPGFSSTREILQNSQRKFFALDMGDGDFDLTRGEDSTLLSLDVTDAAGDGILEHVASTYDPRDDRIRDGIFPGGSPVITFARMLKHGSYPLADVLAHIVDMGQKGMGSPVEIEFAASLGDGSAPELNLLQIRPLLTRREHTHVALDNGALKKDDMVVISTNSMGNCVIDDIRDVVFVARVTFDRTRSVEVAAEIAGLNRELGERPYILIGPGRWGSKDRFLGIPIGWASISGARTIVETPMEDMSVDPSHGSHFFHNVTSLGIPYLTVVKDSGVDFVDWDWLEAREPESAGSYVRHLRFVEPLLVRADGRCGHGLIYHSGAGR